mgnify:FL=1
MAGLIEKDRSCQHCGKSPITGYKYCSACKYPAKLIYMRKRGGHKERKEQLRAQKEAIKQQVEGIGVKVCTQCNKEKAMIEFSLQGKRGRKAICKKCFIEKDTTSKERMSRWVKIGTNIHHAKIWKHANPERHKEVNERRRSRILSTADGTITKDALSKLIKTQDTCPYCGKEMGSKKKSVDHIIPLAKGGEHILSNIAICCLICNISKGSKLLT